MVIDRVDHHLVGVGTMISRALSKRLICDRSEQNLVPTPECATSTALENCRCSRIVRIEVGEESELVYSASNKTATVLPTSLANLLEVCDKFKPLAEHAEECYHLFRSRQHEVDATLSRLSAQSLPRFV